MLSSHRSSRVRLFGMPLVLALGAALGFGQQVDSLTLTVGKSIVLDYPADIRQISTSDPAVVGPQQLDQVRHGSRLPSAQC